MGATYATILTHYLFNHLLDCIPNLNLVKGICKYSHIHIQYGFMDTALAYINCYNEKINNF